jgi:uncharacterized membrane protein
MKWLKMIGGEWKLIASALVAGAMLHIAATLYGANIAQSRAFTTLAGKLPINEVVFADAVTPENQPLPFFAPGSFYSYCRYDASTARVGLTAKLPGIGWSLSLYTRKGENFYYVAGKDVRETDVRLVLVPPGNLFVDASPANTPQSGPAIPRVALPEAEGIAILRAPIKGHAFRRQADEQRGAFRCQSLQ